MEKPVLPSGADVVRYFQHTDLEVAATVHELATSFLKERQQRSIDARLRARSGQTLGGAPLKKAAPKKKKAGKKKTNGNGTKTEQA